MYKLNENIMLMLKQIKVLKKDYNNHKEFIKLNIATINKELKNEK